MGTTQGNSRGLFKSLHPFFSFASQLLSDRFSIHAHDAGKKSGVNESLRGLRCVFHSSRGIIPEGVVLFLKGWAIDYTCDGMNTFPVVFHNSIREVLGGEYLVNRLVDLQGMREERRGYVSWIRVEDFGPSRSIEPTWGW